MSVRGQKAQKPAAPPQLNVEWWPISRPKPYPANARKLSSRAIETLAKSLKEFGWRQPIVVDVKDVIVAGHTRLLAALALGMTQVPVHVARELTAAQIRAYRIMDNRSADETEWDMPTLEAELAELAALEVDLSMTGFGIDELAEIMKADPLTDEDEVPAVPAVPVSRLGDLWLLGGHRVLCGDSTSLEAVKFAAPCVAMWTDPPYGVNYVGKTKDALKVINDEPASDVVAGAMAAAKAVLAPSSPFYIAHPAGGARMSAFYRLVEEAGWRVHQELIWAKDSMVLGHSDYHFQHEPIMYGYTAGEGRPGRGKHAGTRWYGGDAQTSLFTIPRPSRSPDHPTGKPVELVRRQIINSSLPGAAIYDPFLGGGTTVIACESAGRNCRGLEIVPSYVDVIVLRWQAFTGQAATLESDGRTFQQTAAARAKKATATK